jgi:hypothetical protein
LAVINPGLIMGPNLNTASFTSGNIIKGMMEKEPTEDGFVISCVDVRQVAKAHLEAAKR